MNIFLTIIDHKIVAKILFEINLTLKRINKLPRMGGDGSNVSLMHFYYSVIIKFT